jgi:hypothetical protein
MRKQPVTMVPVPKLCSIKMKIVKLSPRLSIFETFQMRSYQSLFFVVSNKENCEKNELDHLQIVWSIIEMGIFTLPETMKETKQIWNET